MNDGRTYALSGENLTITTTLPLLTIATSATEMNAGGRFKLRRVEISQNGTATAAMVRFEICKRDQAATLTITGGTPAPLDVGGPISAFVSNTAGHTPLNCGFAATVDSNGTYTHIMYMNFCNLNGYLWIPTPGEEIIIHNTSVLCIKPVAAPGAAAGWTCTVVWDEF